MADKDAKRREIEAGEPILKSSVAGAVTKGPTDRTFTFVFSTEDLDRDHDVIIQKGIDFKAFRKNPVLLFAHDHSSPPIGMVDSLLLRDGNLTGMIRLLPKGIHDLADIVNDTLTEGFPLATSIGFIPKTFVFNEDHNGFDFETIELMEISIVPVPSNRAALRLAAAAKSAGPDSEVVKWAAAVLQNCGAEISKDLKETTKPGDEARNFEPTGPVKVKLPAVVETDTDGVGSEAENLDAVEIVCSSCKEFPCQHYKTREEVKEGLIGLGIPSLSDDDAEELTEATISEAEPTTESDEEPGTAEALETVTPEVVEPSGTEAVVPETEIDEVIEETPEVVPEVVTVGITLADVSKAVADALAAHDKELADKTSAKKNLDNEVRAEIERQAQRLAAKEKIEAATKTGITEVIRERLEYHTGRLAD